MLVDKVLTMTFGFRFFFVTVLLPMRSKVTKLNDCLGLYQYIGLCSITNPDSIDAPIAESKHQSTNCKKKQDRSITSRRIIRDIDYPYTFRHVRYVCLIMEIRLIVIGDERCRTFCCDSHPIDMLYTIPEGERHLCHALLLVGI